MLEENGQNTGLLSNRDKNNRLQGFEIFHLGWGGVQFHLNDQSGAYLNCTTKKRFNEPKRWYHIVVTYDGTKTVDGIKIYLNGISQELVTDAKDEDRLLDAKFIESPVPLHFGTRPKGVFSFTPLQGAIDEIRVYDRLLTSTEIEHFHLHGIGRMAGSMLGGGVDEFARTLLVTMSESGQPTVRFPATSLKEELSKLENELMNVTRRWYVNGQGQTMVVIPYSLTKDYRNNVYDFAVSSHEITVGEFLR